jgi:predicted nucleic acid-binding protein
MKYVLDASVGPKAVLPEVHSDKAVRLLDEYRRALYDLLSPDFYPIEVAHTITRAERQGQIPPEEGAVAMQATLQLLPQLEAAVPLLPRAYAVSSALRVSVYDCVYVALAEREGCELVTADDKLVKNLGMYYPFIVPLASLP